MKIDFSHDQLVALYRNGGDEARKAIREALGDDFATEIPVTERIKSFEDAQRELGEDHPCCKAWLLIKYSYTISDTDPETADILAYATLRLITEALNEGWKPTFAKDERRWYACYELLTQDELDEMSDEEKEERRVVGRASFNADADGGLDYAYAYYVSSYSYANVGSRLAFKNEELAEYAGKLFAEIYADFCFIPKAACKAEE